MLTKSLEKSLLRIIYIGSFEISNPDSVGVKIILENFHTTISAVHSEYFEKLAKFALRFHDRKSTKNLVEHYIYTGYCNIDNDENQPIRMKFRRWTPKQCAENSGLIRFDIL